MAECESTIKTFSLDSLHLPLRPGAGVRGGHFVQKVKVVYQ